jgi:hypothetical protein
MEHQKCQAGNNEQKSSTSERLAKELFQSSKAVSQEVALSLSGNQGQRPESVDALIASEMNQLSMEERDKIFSDIHGVADIVKEAPGFINFQLLQLETELTKIETKTAYNLAKSLSADYVNDPKFRLLFLRASSFDVNAAATQMVRFFDEKLELFGAEKLTKDIEWSDLDEDDIETVESGWFQVLPEKDQSGRIIACSFPRLQSFRTARSMVRHSDDLFPHIIFYFTEKLVLSSHPLRFVRWQLRAFYFFSMAVLQEEEAQERGFVFLNYDLGPIDFNRDLNMLKRRMTLHAALPVRMVSIHVCISDALLRPVLDFACFVLRKKNRLRTRVHFGEFSLAFKQGNSVIASVGLT